MVNTGVENALLNGIVTGSFIALGAIGLSLVYNIADVPNFAHGELLMIGAYAALLVNRPQEVPGLRGLTTSAEPVTGGVMAVLFLATTLSAVGTVYLLGGRAALEGSWWPIDASTPTAVVVHALAAIALGAIVAATAPSIWAGFVLSGLLLAFLAPMLDRYVFRKFRESGAALATMLMATMGLAFVLRFTTQAIFGGSRRGYRVDATAELFGLTIDVRRAKFLDYYVTGDGVVLEVIDTAADPNATLVLAGYSWPTVGVAMLGTVAAAYAAYRLRGAGVGEHEATPTFSPRLAGVVAAAVAAVVLLSVLAGPAARPESADAIYATRIRTSYVRLSVVAIAIVLMGALHVLLQETKLGTAMRASSDNLDLARITGIDTDRVMMTTWIIAGSYAAIGGITIGILFHQIVPSMGFYRLLPIFAAVILGGLASVYGAIVGAFAVGLAMEVGFYGLNGVWTVSGTHRVSLAFALLLIVLLVKPEGIVGGR